MSEQNFTTTFAVDQSPEQVFSAIADVRGWWSGEIDGATDALGAEFTYRHKDVHSSTQKITEFAHARRVVWHVSDAKLNFVADKTEWNGTDIVFDIARLGGKTKVTFTHVGLVPRFECYGGCSSAWGYYINESLRGLIEKGEGRPNMKES
jgi:hypothetical protein